jgi:Kelch motif
VERPASKAALTHSGSRTFCVPARLILWPRTEIAVAEVGGKIYLVGGFRGEREHRWSRGAANRARFIMERRWG